MLEYLNKDNGQIVTVPDQYKERYDRACNMVRVNVRSAVPDDLTKLSLDELTPYAEERGVDLSEVKPKKSHIIEAIEAAMGETEDQETKTQDSESEE